MTDLRNWETSAAECARTLLRYEPETGKLFWRARPRDMFANDRDHRLANAKYCGKEAFTTISSGGYFCGQILGKKLYAHRVIWLIQTGKHPEDEIDHINGVRLDNRWINLRAASRSQNCKNMGLGIRNTSGVAGVHWDKRANRWVASIMVDGWRRHIGTFATLDAARDARAAAIDLHGFTARHGKPAGARP